ncbi:MAG: LLM class F420-dependent oxidoreductase [Pseudomonadales bacterium]|nr:LLM class F420-dependent oxidoreductase [Pseudomonadales bacterium]
MKFSFWPAPTHTFDENRQLAEHVEKKGWDGLWLADHFMPNAEDTSAAWPEAWTTLAGIAASIPRLRLGTLVTGNTYRHPAVLAKMAATVDHISGGRLVLGMGSGWQENEHEKYGIEFGTIGERLEKLEEACQIIKGLFSSESTTFNGRYYTMTDAPQEPKPVQSPLPLLIGGGGEKVTLRITARYADEWNVWGNVAELTHKMNILDQHCANLDRNPSDIQRSAVALVFITEDVAFAEKMNDSTDRPPKIAGTVSELQDVIGAYKDAGVNEFIFPDFTLGPGVTQQKLDTLDQFMEEIAPAGR